MRQLILMPLLALCACATTAAQLPPSTLPGSVIVDDQLGVAVETAYVAAATAERLVGAARPAWAPKLIQLDNQAYVAVCDTRTAYDVANGIDPNSRVDTCPAITKTNRVVTYTQAAQAALEVIKQLVATSRQALAAPANL